MYLGELLFFNFEIIIIIIFVMKIFISCWWILESLARKLHDFGRFFSEWSLKEQSRWPAVENFDDFPLFGDFGSEPRHANFWGQELIQQACNYRQNHYTFRIQKCKFLSRSQNWLTMLGIRVRFPTSTAGWRLVFFNGHGGQPFNKVILCFAPE